jgi:hypothetical protein
MLEDGQKSRSPATGVTVGTPDLLSTGTNVAHPVLPRMEEVTKLNPRILEAWLNQVLSEMNSSQFNAAL